MLPFLPLLFARRGLGPVEIGWVMMVVPVSGVLVPPIWGALADFYKSRVLLLRVACLGCAVSVLLLWPEWGLLGALLGMSVLCLFRASLTPLIDALAYAQLKDKRTYPKVRLWGSIGFIVFVTLVGRMEASDRPTILLGVPAVAYAISALTTLRFSSVQAASSSGRGFGELRRLSPVLIFLCLGNLSYYAGHAVLDGFFALHARALGHSEAFIGRAWAIGVVAETGIMFVAPRLQARFQKLPWLALCGGVAALRWYGLSVVQTEVGVLAVQTLHGVTFGLWYISMVAAVQSRAPEALRTSVQSIAQASLGAGAAGGFLIAGPIFERFGGAAAFRFACIAAAIAALFYALDHAFVGRKA